MSNHIAVFLMLMSGVYVGVLIVWAYDRIERWWHK
jgi:hypothetical protein